MLPRDWHPLLCNSAVDVFSFGHGRAQEFSLGHDRSAKGRERGPGERKQPLPTSCGVWGSVVNSPSKVRSGAPLEGFPLFRMASSDTIILLTVDYRAAIGGKTPVPPLRMPLVLGQFSLLAYAQCTGSDKKDAISVNRFTQRAHNYHTKA